MFETFRSICRTVGSYTCLLDVKTKEHIDFYISSKKVRPRKLESFKHILFFFFVGGDALLIIIFIFHFIRIFEKASRAKKRDGVGERGEESGRSKALRGCGKRGRIPFETRVIMMLTQIRCHSRSWLCLSGLWDASALSPPLCWGQNTFIFRHSGNCKGYLRVVVDLGLAL